MGLPNINIIFKEAASTVLIRAQKGIVALILKDSTVAVQGKHVFLSAEDIPAAMTAGNKDYIKQAFIGNDSKPKKVLCYVLPDTAANLKAATDWLGTQKFSWLAAPPEAVAADTAELLTWIVAQRAAGRHYKAVLPDKIADNYALVNFTTKNIKVGDNTYTAAGYCARIAGLIAGTSLTSAITFAVLPEVTAVEQLTRAEMDAATDGGKLLLLHDGSKVKCGSGVTSLTGTAGTIAAYKKIKIVEALDLISEDITGICEDGYVGKYSNSYDNKLLLVTAIRGYFDTLENEGVLKKGSSIDIDLAATTQYLKDKGLVVGEMSERELREADTGDKVFLCAKICVLDAIENISLTIAI
ncbi:MAG: phage tail sheath C-terminal domain-containing protein [Oscillospiraceae bacterium]